MPESCARTPARSNVCLAGDNGAGKSTLIKAISGVFQDDEGDIYLDGKRVAFATPQEAHKESRESLPRSRHRDTTFWRARHVESL